MAHIEGGEVSQGAIDDAVRNALTKLAHVHFTSTPTARARVIAMGEEPWRVHRAGAPSLDHVRRSRLWTRAELEARLGLDLTQPTVLVAYHPVTIERETTREAEAVFAALAAVPEALVMVYPNSDAGSRALVERAQELVLERERIGRATRIFVNLDAVTYWSLLGQVRALVGNSSSGIMEAASFALPAVNIGMRQQGRERGRNVIDVAADAGAIEAGIGRALTAEFRESLVGMTNPYGDGHAAERIAEVLATVELDGLLVKAPAPIPGEGA
jgi:UDP-N-acetylglucosamine 2-epimerase (non-hydrolysing)/GDP/UDP-N,N'-diacetylbacillosamine 2-epimerase (hydrolysing)